MAYKDTLEILNALKAKLEALKWTPPATQAHPAPAEETAFHKVEIFDITDLELALGELRAFKDRACFIVMDTENYENQFSGNNFTSRQSRNVALVFTDRDYGKRQRALTGSETKPGVLALKDLILNPQHNIVGLLMTGVACLPTVGTQLRIVDKSRDDLSGRLAYTQDLELRGGFELVKLGAAAVL